MLWARVCTFIYPLCPFTLTRSKSTRKVWSRRYLEIKPNSTASERGTSFGSFIVQTFNGATSSLICQHVLTRTCYELAAVLSSRSISLPHCFRTYSTYRMNAHLARQPLSSTKPPQISNFCPTISSLSSHSFLAIAGSRACSLTGSFEI